MRANSASPLVRSRTSGVLSVGDSRNSVRGTTWAGRGATAGEGQLARVVWAGIRGRCAITPPSERSRRSPLAASSDTPREEPAAIVLGRETPARHRPSSPSTSQSVASDRPSWAQPSRRLPRPGRGWPSSARATRPPCRARRARPASSPARACSRPSARARGRRRRRWRASGRGGVGPEGGRGGVRRGDLSSQRRAPRAGELGSHLLLVRHVCGLVWCEGMRAWKGQGRVGKGDEVDGGREPANGARVGRRFHQQHQNKGALARARRLGPRPSCAGLRLSSRALA